MRDDALITKRGERAASARSAPLTVKALAALLDLSPQSIRRAIKAEFIMPSDRSVGGRARFSAEDAEHLKARVQAARDRGRVRLIRHLLAPEPRPKETPRERNGHNASGRLTPDGRGGLTVSQALEDYYHEHVIPNVVDQVRAENAIRHLKAWFKRTLLRDIDIPANRAYADARRKGTIGGGKRRRHAPGRDSTIRRELVVLRAAARHALRWRRITVTDLPTFELPREGRREVISEDDWLTKAELRRVINAARGRLRAFILTAYYTAGRRKSVETLTKSQVNLDAWQIKLRGPDETPQQQRSTKRRPTVPIHPKLRPTIKRLMRTGASKWLFGDPRDMYREFCELVEVVVPAKKASPHILRHSRATHLLQDGVAILAVARLLGDSVATVDRVYAHCSVGYLAEAIGDKGL